MATGEVGAIRWVVASPPAEEWLETSSSHEIPATFSSENDLGATTIKAGELVGFPVG